MKKIRIVFIVCLLFLVLGSMSACNLLEGFLSGDKDNDNNGAENGQSEIELDGKYILTSMTEEHKSPCDYVGTHEDSIPLAFMLSAYNGAEIVFESGEDGEGTFTLTIPESIEENDNYFVARSGEYEIDGDGAVLVDGEKEMSLKLEDGKLIFSLPEFEVDSGEHEGHMAVYSFVFEKVEE